MLGLTDVSGGCCSVTATDSHGRTPISVAAAHGAEAILKVLLAAKARLDLTDHDGCSVAWWAASAGSAECLQVSMWSCWHHPMSPLSAQSGTGGPDRLGCCSLLIRQLAFVKTDSTVRALLLACQTSPAASRTPAVHAAPCMCNARPADKQAP